MSLRGKKILVTGGTGFIGRNLIEILLRNQAEVISCNRRGKIKGTTSINVDLTKSDYSFLNGINLDYAVHLAAFSSPKRSINEKEVISLNVESTRKFFEALRKKDIKKAIFMSSAVVYAKSNSPLREDSMLEQNPGIYAKSKILAEKSISEIENLHLIIFRLSNGYGPKQQWREEEKPTLIPELIRDSIIKGRMTVIDISPVRDFIYVDDISNAIIAALQSDYTGVLNLGSGKGKSIGEVVMLVGNLTKRPIHYINRETHNSRVTLDIQKTSSVLNWEPRISLEEGLYRTVKYYQEEVGRSK